MTGGRFWTFGGQISISGDRFWTFRGTFSISGGRFSIPRRSHSDLSDIELQPSVLPESGRRKEYIFIL
jgi:hypothetical protein